MPHKNVESSAKRSGMGGLVVLALGIMGAAMLVPTTYNMVYGKSFTAQAEMACKTFAEMVEMRALKDYKPSILLTCGADGSLYVTDRVNGGGYKIAPDGTRSAF